MKIIVVLNFIVAGFYLQTTNTFGQEKIPPIELWYVQDTIQRLFQEIQKVQDDSSALTINHQIELILERVLKHPSAYKFKFDSLKMVGRLYAPRKKFRIFNWNIPMRDGTHHHFAFIVVYAGEKAYSKVIRLNDMSDSIAKPEQQTLGPEKWIGMLYYKIVPPRKTKGQKYYTLLGLDLNNLQTKKKIIEILSFNANNEPKFGAPIIEWNKRTYRRLIFEFSAKQSMYLEYNWWKRKIELDHLAPLMPYLVGEYEYYEPDLYQDALKFKKGHWKHYKDIREPPKDKKLKKRNLPKPKPVNLKKISDQKTGTETEETNTDAE